VAEAVRPGILRSFGIGRPAAGAAGTAAMPSVKRALDVAGAGFGLVVLAPVFALVSAVIRLDSPGPALFEQERVGLRGRRFVMYKFRTMRAGNSSDVHERYVAGLIRGEDDGLRNGTGAFKLENDDRVTRIGRMLRATSLDELPQLINVFRGDMSLVGPRPPLPYEVELYTPRHARRLDVVPGITGLWQVSGRNETTFEEMIDLDLAYIEGWSPLLDMRILARTVSAMRKGG
jgi:lipopolysaccharide/colanic/teichoic acid biosynthesis glycosyltransferase